MFDQVIMDAARDHALQEWPNEAVGIVVANRYRRLFNISDDIKNKARWDPKEIAGAYATGQLQAMIHSHPNGQASPSHVDMVMQTIASVPWGVVVLKEFDKDGVLTPAYSESFFWGDGVTIIPFVGRTFRHGVHDCYGLIRDWYNVQRGIILTNYPREDGWWEPKGEGNILDDQFVKEGFIKLDDFNEVDIGDILLFQVDAAVTNHCSVYLGEGLMLHHIYGRLSTEVPAIRYRAALRHVLRYGK